MNKEKGKIAICSECNNPLVWTFLFSGAEYYCLCCGRTYGMFGCKNVEFNKELKHKQNIYNNVFKSIMKDFVPHGAKYKKCKKCHEDAYSYHIGHMTELEKMKSNIAYKIISNLRIDCAESEGEENG